jgi:putative ABC transport system permease protein
MFEEAPLIVKSLRRHGLSVSLIVCQVALTLTVLINCGIVVLTAIRAETSVTGIDEPDIAFIQSISIIGMAGNTSVVRNLQELSRLPYVIGAAFGRLPLMGSPKIDISIDKNMESTLRANYFEGSQGYSKTLGVHLIAGELIDDLHIPDLNKDGPLPVLVTASLSKRLYGSDNGVGRIFRGHDRSFLIVGVISNLTSTLKDDDPGDSNSIIASVRYGDVDVGGIYVIRADRGRLFKAKEEAEELLRKLNPSHVQSTSGTFQDLRDRAVLTKIAPANVLGVVMLILIAITGFGVGSITTMWVKQRRRQIGIRLALGATSKHILVYFMLENAIIVGGGSLLGIILSILLALYLAKFAEIGIPSLGYFIVGPFFMVILGQVFALGPAFSASRLPPSQVIRGQ